MSVSKGNALSKAVIEELKAHPGLFIVMGVYWACCVGLGLSYDFPIKPWLYAPVFALIPVLIVLFCGAKSLPLVGAGHLYKELKMVFSVPVVAHVGIMLTGFSITVSLFQSVKAMIPAVQPFVFDAAFSKADKLIHGGFYPHELLQSLLGYPAVSFVVLILYNLWLPLVFLVFIIQIVGPVSDLQHRYLMSFLLAWILIGTVGAILLSSAGPAYYEQVVGLAPGTGPYSDLLSYYERVEKLLPFFLTDMHAMLWQFYQSGELGPGAGISAMPSVHVALATHMFLVMRHRGKVAGRIFGTYAVVIALGSVHLGWHYAIDGYLGAALMCAIWWLCGLFGRGQISAEGHRLDQDQGLTP